MYTVKTFGAAECFDGPVPIDLPPTTLLLLIYLALRSEGATREHLWRTFWPQSSSSLGRHALSQQLYALRRRMRKLQIKTDSTHIRLITGSVQVDAGLVISRGRELSTETLLGFTGGFLESYDGRLTPELQCWKDEVESAWGRAYVDAVLHRASEAEHASDWTQTAELLSRAYRTGQPTKALCVRLLASLRAIGRESEADAVYKESCAIFGNEWAHQHATSSPETLDRAADLGGPRFVGRVREFNRLRELWARTKAGVPTLVLLTGEAGIGKTRLAHQLQKLCALQGGHTTAARTFESGRRIAYAALPALMRDLTSTPAGTTLVAPQIDGSADSNGSASDRMQPLLRAADLAHAFGVAIANAASTRALLIVVDDCQWLDQATADLLAYLKGTLIGCKVMFACCARPDDSPAVNDVLRPCCDEELVLAALSPEEAAALAHQAHPSIDELAATRVIDMAGGNPFFLLELLSQQESGRRTDGGAVAELPTSLQRLVGDKYQRLSAAGRRLATVAAVLDSAALPAVIGAVSGMQHDEVFDGLEELIHQGFVDSAAGTALGLKHDILREGVYRHTPAKTRMLLHARSARVLRRAGAAPATVADHAEKGGLKKLAFSAALAAGDQAAATHADRDALHWYTRAASMQLGVRPFAAAAGRILELATLGRIPQSSATAYTQALRQWYRKNEDRLGLLRCEYIDLYESLLSGNEAIQQRVDRLLAIGIAAEEGEDPLFAVEAYKEAVASASYSLPRHGLAALLRSTLGKELEHSHTAVPVLSFFAASMVVCGTSEEAVEWAEKAVHRAEEGGVPQHGVQAYAARASAYWSAGRLQAAMSDYELALSEAEKLVHVSNINGLRCNFALLLMDMEEYERAERLLDAVSAASRNRGHVALINRTILAYETGQYEKASSLLDECLELAERVGAAWLRTVTHAIRGLISLNGGDRANAIRCWDAVRDDLMPFLEATAEPVLVATFAARMIRIEHGLEPAAGLLRSAASDVQPRNAVMWAKLRLELAELLLDVEPDKSYSIAKDALLFGRRSGATAICNRAQAILEHIQLKVR